MNVIKKRISKKATYWISVAVFGIVSGFGLQLARAAWTEPSVGAPGGNVGAPINTGNAAQGRMGSFGIGGLTPGALLDVWGAVPNEGTNSTAVNVNGVFPVTAFSTIKGITSRVTTANSGYTVAQSMDYYAPNANKGAGSSISNQYGLYVDDLTSGTKNWAVYTAGNTPSFFNGNVGIGTTTPTAKLEVNNVLKLSNGAADTNDGKIGTATFAPGLNIVGINTDGNGRKVNEWGSIIQNENPSGNRFIGNTNFSGGNIQTDGNIIKTGLVLGDADADGRVGMADATALLRFVVGLGGPCANANCDLDKNGAINISDALQLLKILSGVLPLNTLPLESQAVFAGMPGVIRGDVNYDKQINTLDATEILKNVVGLSNSCTPALCDINNSGTVDITDALNLLKMVTGVMPLSSLPLESASIMSVQPVSKPNMGDVNYNGRLDMGDVNLILGGAVGLNNCDALVCNINGDNTVDIADALKLLRIVNNLDPSSALPTESQALMMRKDTCTWVNGPTATCADQQYVAGMNFPAQKIYCCYR